ncbi:hypothetical protein BOTBODRAFT_176904 [Botryobasidium botryosum FD-172 SS1]|uniref:F-box domain-containing protein n=1 Tax=Botryobasidium botryosum (strain FD-172 SS1) TaxID=930990 RepID=A0A067MB55_BOTB1|nr:hypothetical protein BOTBODRAFT_176904 [Botryobasidium botryosum FD-172 SS1]
MLLESLQPSRSYNADLFRCPDIALEIASLLGPSSLLRLALTSHEAYDFIIPCHLYRHVTIHHNTPETVIHDFFDALFKCGAAHYIQTFSLKVPRLPSLRARNGGLRGLSFDVFALLLETHCLRRLLVHDSYNLFSEQPALPMVLCDFSHLADVDLRRVSVDQLCGLSEMRPIRRFRLEAMQSFDIGSDVAGYQEIRALLWKSRETLEFISFSSLILRFIFLRDGGTPPACHDSSNTTWPRVLTLRLSDCNCDDWRMDLSGTFPFVTEFHSPPTFTFAREHSNQAFLLALTRVRGPEGLFRLLSDAENKIEEAWVDDYFPYGQPYNFSSYFSPTLATLSIAINASLGHVGNSLVTLSSLCCAVPRLQRLELRLSAGKTRFIEYIAAISPALYSFQLVQLTVTWSYNYGGHGPLRPAGGQAQVFKEIPSNMPSLQLLTVHVWSERRGNVHWVWKGKGRDQEFCLKELTNSEEEHRLAYDWDL